MLEAVRDGKTQAVRNEKTRSSQSVLTVQGVKEYAIQSRGLQQKIK
jgi:hypothetical protein